MQLVRLRAASQGAGSGGVRGGPGHDLAVGSGAGGRWRGRAGAGPGGGPKGASKLTPQLAARIAGLDAAGATLREIAAATGVSTFSVRNALGRVASDGRPAAAGITAGQHGRPRRTRAHGRGGSGAAGPGAPGRRAGAGPVGLLGEGAVPVFTPGARYPLAGLLLALPVAGGHRPAGRRPRRSTASSRTGSTGWARRWCSWRWPAWHARTTSATAGPDSPWTPTPLPRTTRNRMRPQPGQEGRGRAGPAGRSRRAGG